MLYIEGRGPASLFIRLSWHPYLLPPHQPLRWTLVHLKDRVEPKCRAGVVYRIPCRAILRQGVHWPDKPNPRASPQGAQEGTFVSGDTNLSAVVQHVADEGHEINWSSAPVIDGHPNFHQRCALEAWHIRSQDSFMNRDAGPLPPMYNP